MLSIYVMFALYRIISLQSFNVVVKPNKLTCLHIDQQATNEKWADFYKNINGLEQFSKSISIF